MKRKCRATFVWERCLRHHNPVSTALGFETCSWSLNYYGRLRTEVMNIHHKVNRRGEIDSSYKVEDDDTCEWNEALRSGPKWKSRTWCSDLSLFFEKAKSCGPDALVDCELMCDLIEAFCFLRIYVSMDVNFGCVYLNTFQSNTSVYHMQFYPWMCSARQSLEWERQPSLFSLPYNKSTSPVTTWVRTTVSNTLESVRVTSSDKGRLHACFLVDHRFGHCPHKRTCVPDCKRIPDIIQIPARSQSGCIFWRTSYQEGRGMSG